MYSYIGRQPIYNKMGQVVAYDVLHRDNVTKNIKLYTDENMSNVFAELNCVFDINELTALPQDSQGDSEQIPAFVGFTRQLLLNNLPYVLDPERIIIEIPWDTDFVTVQYSQLTPQLALNVSSWRPRVFWHKILLGPRLDLLWSWLAIGTGQLPDFNNIVTDKMVELKRAGYKLALGGYTVRNGVMRLNQYANYFNYIYINVNQNNRVQIRDMINKIRRASGAQILAEQVDTKADMEKISGLDFMLYQGLLYGRPEILRKEVNISVTPWGHLYNNLSGPSATYDSVTKEIAGNRLMTNFFLQTTPVDKKGRVIDATDEVKKPMLTTGLDRLRRWSVLVMLKQLNVNENTDYARAGYCRGRFMEEIIQECKLSVDNSDAFFTGVFSMMSLVTDTPFDGLFGQLRLEREIRDVVTGKDTQSNLAKLLAFARVYQETGKRSEDIKMSISDRYLENLLEKCKLAALPRHPIVSHL